MGSSRGNRAELLLFVLPLLTEPPEQILAALRKSSTDLMAIEKAMRAGRTAILALPVDRWLTVAECCVFVGLGEARGNKLLRESFRGGGQYRAPGDFRKASLTKPMDTVETGLKRGGNRNQVWIHRREAVAAWWKTHVAEDRRRVPRSKSAKSRPEAIDRAANLADVVQRVERDYLSMGRADLWAAVTEDFPWLINQFGRIEDALAFPAMGDDAIAKTLTTGTVQFATLDVALNHMAWEDVGRREPWADVLRTLIERERVKLNLLRTATDSAPTLARAEALARRPATRGIRRLHA